MVLERVPSCVYFSGDVFGLVLPSSEAVGAASPPLGASGSIGWVAAVPSNTPRRDSVPITVKAMDVHMNKVAKAAVNFVKKFAPPLLPNTVWLEPPKEALISAPFPD